MPSTALEETDEPRPDYWTRDDGDIEFVVPDIHTFLAEREARYGQFRNHAAISQSLTTAMVTTPGWQALSPSQKESLEMIAHKIARILNGDPSYVDNWTDISGYATLVVDILNEDAQA